MSTISPGLGPARRSRAVRAVSLAISLIALAGIGYWASSQPPPELPTDRGEILALALALALYGLSTLLRGERWWQLLRGSAAGEPARLDCYALITVGYMWNNLLPARGGDIVRAALLQSRAGAGMRPVLATVIAEKILDAVVITVVFVILAYGLLRGIDAPDSDSLLLVLAVITVVAAALLALARLGRRRPLIRRALGFVAPLGESTRRLASRGGVAMILLTVTIWAVDAGAVMAIGSAVNESLTPLESLYLVAVAAIFLLVPAAPGQLGTFDAGVLFGARAVGLGAAGALSFALLVRFVFFVPITLVGLGFFLGRYRSIGTGGDQA